MSRPTAARGHIPFPDHRTIADIRDEERAEELRLKALVERAKARRVLERTET